MNIKLKLAQWLAPEVFRDRDQQKRLSMYWLDNSGGWWMKAMKMSIVLRDIASQRTPKANATVNRMADMAEAALKGEG